ncbi:prephenate dehydratase [Ketogulonicigenium robustum]|uniref:prephenate dehydratase n=1 Tax=Ketogulonicigenium robustum TaxID=92947 RepID=A0A1W6NXX4_9RHOB|nr:prephenate dehydratase [Ketogulonicigenium robustum]ARO14039.1 prephenate dehydratase [Ketogulonicigenium robustum]
MTTTTRGRIAYQGAPGAYSHQACIDSRPEFEPVPFATFEDAIEAVRSGAVDLGMIPVENSTYGRVADVHQLLPESGLHVIDEAFVRVHVNLLAVPGATLADIRDVRAMPVLLGQARSFIRDNGLNPVAWSDNAGAARDVAALGDKSVAAMASEIAGQITGLHLLARHVEDNDLNTTRFLVMSRTPDYARRGAGKMMTSLIFRVRNIPAALYKAMGGFATNGVNMTKLESYMVGGHFTATQFYAEIEGHPDDRSVQLALEELDYFTDTMALMGVFPASPTRNS